VDVFVPSEFYLSQNFPNPFNGQTNIKYCIPVKAKVNLNIYNNDGDLIKELVNNTQEAGTYEITWDAEGLPSGVYFYKLKATPNIGQAGNYVSTKKMILIK
jgi:flagellar hook assembly protein FlgD